jgi:hypothetical protein
MLQQQEGGSFPCNLQESGIIYLPLMPQHLHRHDVGGQKRRRVLVQQKAEMCDICIEVDGGDGDSILASAQVSATVRAAATRHD